MIGFRALLFLLICVLAITQIPLAYAQTARELEDRIGEHNRQIAALQAEIAQYQKELDSLGKQKNTLQSAINSLTLSQKQLSAQLSVTQNKIDAANLELKRLSLAIGDKEETIEANQKAIAKALRDTAQGEHQSLIEQLFSAGSLPQAWQAAEEVLQFNRALREDILELRVARQELTTNRDAVAKKKSELVSLQNDLILEKKSVDANKAAQQSLLTQTKNQEVTYQKLITEKKAAERAFEQALDDLESQLDLIVNPRSLPKVGSGVLAWPFA